MFEPPRQNDEDSATPARRGSPNCRTCTDFKTWTMQQTANTKAPTSRQASTTAAASASASTSRQAPPAGTTNAPARDCPYDKDELGRATWGLLHTMAAHYPDKPTAAEAKDVTTFFTVLSKLYPCEPCAKDFQEEIKVEPINTTSQCALSQWLCRLHNKVNVKLDKPVFDCSKVNQRWRDGWTDGSCD